MHFYAGLLPLERAVETIQTVRPLAEREGVRLFGSFFFIGRWAGVPSFGAVTPPTLLNLRRMAQEVNTRSWGACISLKNYSRCYLHVLWFILLELHISHAE